MVFGKHYIVDYIDCDKNIINSIKKIEKIMLDVALEINASVVSSNFNMFYPYGVSGVLIIAESHFTVHTWVEEGFVAIDMFVCDLDMDLDKAVELFKNKLKAKTFKIKKIKRDDDL
ncbi:adenosylmethionine decarboxylase [Caminibacter mediatlanticus]|uniref:Uncharacterized protein n=1 Tax=Caminibacter mediatlanticus TB-2 TaxID=391592 RepID=A0AAI9AFW1_9BACT|nr:adenosylmethionine decarboxylase [Caminibacter mediatlanticus]EDM22913.1 hypothetical protein CMTB2_05477 [Caminibacter mediatlanticus TB-2]